MSQVQPLVQHSCVATDPMCNNKDRPEPVIPRYIAVQCSIVSDTYLCNYVQIKQHTAKTARPPSLPAAS